MSTLLRPRASESQLQRFADLIYDATGMRLSPQKRELLAGRLRRRVKESGLATPGAYHAHLRRLPLDDPEWDALLQEIAAHESYLFRDMAQWDWLQREYLPQMAFEARAGRRESSLRIWSAACSTGDEPFTIAACVAESLPHVRQWDVRILGTDIRADVLDQAHAAVFGSRPMRTVPEEIRDRHFVKIGAAGPWQARTMLKLMVEFRRHNLLERMNEAPFDVVVLKNVLAYFDDASQDTALSHVCQSIQPGGILIAEDDLAGSRHLQNFERPLPWLYVLRIRGG